MTLNEVRTKYLTYFKNSDRNHAVVPSTSLVPENDPSVLFNTAGMQPLVPYLMGQKHPMGTRITSCQKCVRTGDIEDIGDNRHCTFFEMLGNWSLGDYFKTESIAWSFKFLTSKEEGLGLDGNRLYVTVFEGDEDAPRDEESVELWKKEFTAQGVSTDRIFFLPKKNNWWSPGDNGPCGPDTEIFYDTHNKFGGRGITHDEFVDSDDKGELVEIWNNVFMQYLKKDGKVVGKLDQMNVDTGMGLERISMVLQGVDSVFETDVFIDAMNYLKNCPSAAKNNPAGFVMNETSIRVIADHIRASLMLLADGVIPSNKDRGYILRRLIRRAMVRAKQNGIDNSTLIDAEKSFVEKYKDLYPNVANNECVMLLEDELNKFQKTLDTGLKLFEKGNVDAFDLFTTHGFPIELTRELASEKGITLDEEDFNKKMVEHQELSRSGSEQKFKGGLADSSEETTKLHTAHHLLLAALRTVLGPHVHQKGSNITSERLRIDFSHDAKMTDEQKQQVETLVNEWIAKDLPMQRIEIARVEAEKIGAEMEFGAKYPDMVSVYFIGEKVEDAISKEFCGGPHATRTGNLGTFKIQKEEASSSGVRRIKAVLQ